MRNGEWKEITESKFISTSITCDVCGKTYDEDDDCFETQEFISIHHDCGYNSVFGDGNMIYIDICQHCFKEMVGDRINVMEPARINPKVMGLLNKVKRIQERIE